LLKEMREAKWEPPAEHLVARLLDGLDQQPDDAGEVLKKRADHGREDVADRSISKGETPRSV
jgi:hypothetical protein